MPQSIHSIMPGSTGVEVKFAKCLLNLYESCNLSENDIFDSDMEERIENFQEKCGLNADGTIGPLTWKYLAPNLSNCYEAWNRKEIVRAVQNYLKQTGYVYFNADGKYGVSTMAAVEDFQTRNGLVSDGIWGKRCWEVWFTDKAKVTAKIQPKSRKVVKSFFSSVFQRI